MVIRSVPTSPERASPAVSTPAYPTAAVASSRVTRTSTSTAAAGNNDPSWLTSVRSAYLNRTTWTGYTPFCPPWNMTYVAEDLMLAGGPKFLGQERIPYDLVRRPGRGVGPRRLRSGGDRDVDVLVPKLVHKLYLRPGSKAHYNMSLADLPLALRLAMGSWAGAEGGGVNDPGYRVKFWSEFQIREFLRGPNKKNVPVFCRTLCKHVLICGSREREGGKDNHDNHVGDEGGRGCPCGRRICGVSVWKVDWWKEDAAVGCPCAGRRILVIHQHKVLLLGTVHF